jgi:hypothetical protein
LTPEVQFFTFHRNHGIIGIYHQFQPFLSYIMTSTLIVRSTDRPNELTSGTPGRRNVHGDIYNTLFRIISIPSKKKYFRPPDHVISQQQIKKENKFNYRFPFMMVTAANKERKQI